MMPPYCSISLFQVLFGLSATLAIPEGIYSYHILCAFFVNSTTGALLRVRESFQRASLTESQQFMSQCPFLASLKINSIFHLKMCRPNDCVHPVLIPTHELIHAVEALHSAFPGGSVGGNSISWVCDTCIHTYT